MTTAQATKSPPVTKLAEGFEPATREAWRTLVEKAIKGADFEKKMVSKTADGLRIDPIYTPKDAAADGTAAIPGTAPFARGTSAHVKGLGWDIRQFYIEADAATANAAILDDLEGGTNSIGLQMGGDGRLGLEPDAATLSRALHGVMLDMCPISLGPGEAVTAAALALTSVWDGAKIANENRRGAFGADPLGHLAMTGSLKQPIDKALAEAAALAKTASAMPGVTALRADGVVYHVGGATEAQELACMLSTAVAYLRACEAVGLTPAAALPKIEVWLAVDDDQFLGIAKLRAARHLLWRIADACGAANAVSHIQFNAVTSYRMMAKRDPWTNILRTTIACAAGALGGADAICVLPFTFAIGKPDAFSRRVARNIQIVCQEESSLGRVVDPGGGSWYIENLTNDLAAKSWALFQEIEAKGGIAAALQSGFVQGEVAKAAETRAKSIATGRMVLTGVSAFPLLGDDGVTAEPWPQDKPAVTAAAIGVTPLTIARTAEPFEALRDAADAHATKTGKPLTVFLASLGDVIDHNVRSTWIKNYLAAGGIAAAMSDGYPHAAAVAKAFKASGATSACICSSDIINEEHAEATAKALKAAGAKLILMAGRPGEREAALKAAGVDQFLFAGADAVATLKRLHEQLSR